MKDILERMIKTYQNELDDILEAYSLVCAVLGLLKEHRSPDDGETVTHLRRRKKKLINKMKFIQESIKHAQEELESIKEEDK